MSDDLRERVARAIANVREGGWPADTYALLQQHYLTMADAALAEMGGVREADIAAAASKALFGYMDRSDRYSYGVQAGVIRMCAAFRAIAEGKE